MKRAIVVFVLVVAVIGIAVWLKKSVGTAPPTGGAAAGAAAEEEAGASVTRNAKGNAVITLSDEMQGDIGIQVTNPAAARMTPEVKGFGRVLDPAPLVALIAELATDQAAWRASSNELVRLKTLETQANASARALQAAEAAAQRDELAVASARARLALSWGSALADRTDLNALVRALTSLETVLVRIDLPLGENVSAPEGARMVAVSGATSEAELLGAAPSVDPQMQGRGFLFQIRSNAARLSPGEAVTGFLKVPGEPVTGVILPRESVVRTEGAGWVYVLDKSAAEQFTRTQVPLDRPTGAGWFVSGAVRAEDYVVVKGAYHLLSTELKGQGGGE